MIITKDMWQSFSKELSFEALGDEFDATPVGGSAEGDEEMNDSDEQFNEDSISDLGNDDFGFGEGSDDMSGDMSSGGAGDSSGLGTSLKPTDNPFKGQNGRELLDTKLAELYSAVDNSIKLVQSNKRLDKVVIAELSDLLMNIKQVREVVFIQPVETSMFRWALCVKAYHLICKQLCINSKVEQNSK
jgi:hypothetical protein